MDALKGVSGGIGPLPGAEKVRGGRDKGFDLTLKGFIDQVDGQIRDANTQAEGFAVGRPQDLHEIMIATEKADLSFRLLVQVRNKLIEAYQEIMRMQF